MSDNKIRMCLPKGGPMKPLAALLEKKGFPVRDYHEKNRTYRPDVEGLPVRAKIMAEKDVVLQVAAGNYDVGFCGLDWIMEHSVRFRATRVRVLKRLGLNKKYIFACRSVSETIDHISDFRDRKDMVSIVSEYPNLAEHFAIRTKLRHFRIFSAWGSVEAYPPEHADIALIAVTKEEELRVKELSTISGHTCDFDSDLCLIVNRDGFSRKDFSPVLDYFV